MQSESTEKVCTGCKATKPLSGFSIDRRRKDGLQARCKDCQRAAMQAWRKRNPHAPRDYYERNRERMNAIARRYREANPERTVDYQRRHRASKVGGTTPGDRAEIAEARDYSLIILRDPCAYCGGPAIEIDHIVPIEQGGTAAWDNMTPACRCCNARKHKRPLLDALIRGTMVAEMENWATRWEQAA